MTRPEATTERSPVMTRYGAWTLDPAVVFLNHGSFGACPSVVLKVQSELRARMEQEPVRFFMRELEGLLDGVRDALSLFLGAEPEDLGFVPNATTAVNSVLASIELAAGDEIVVTDHGYGACNNAAHRWAERAGASVVSAAIPFPIASPDQARDAVLGAIGPRTRLLLVDHVTSATGLVLPVEAITRESERRGVPVLVDGAHGPGMIPLDLDGLGASYYTGNLHKWCCAPKGAAFLHVRRDRQPTTHPVVTSHGRSSRRSDRSLFRSEFDWMGTSDPTAVLSVPSALAFLEGLEPDGIGGVMRKNRELALAARALLARSLGVPLPCPDSMIGALAAIPLPDAPPGTPCAESALHIEPLQDALETRHGIQVPVHPWPAPPRRLVRISAQRYNRIEHYEALAGALAEELALERA